MPTRGALGVQSFVSQAPILMLQKEMGAIVAAIAECFACRSDVALGERIARIELLVGEFHTQPGGLSRAKQPPGLLPECAGPGCTSTKQ